MIVGNNPSLMISQRSNEEDNQSGERESEKDIEEQNQFEDEEKID